MWYALMAGAELLDKADTSIQSESEDVCTLSSEEDVDVVETDNADASWTEIAHDSMLTSIIGRTTVFRGRKILS